MTYSSHKYKIALWMTVLVAAGASFGSNIRAASDVPRLPENCQSGVELAMQGDRVGAVLAWKASASDLSVKAAGKKVLQCLPLVLFSAEYDKAATWLREAAKSENAETEAIAGLFFLSFENTESDVEEGLSLLQRAAEKGHDGAQFALFAYEIEHKVDGEQN